MLPREHYPIRTGALDDDRRYGLHLVFALFGWVLAAALVGWLLVRASEVQLQVTIFIVTMSLVVALIGSLLVVEAFSSGVVQPPSIPTRIATGNLVDALERPIEIPTAADSMRGCITLDIRDGVRVYRVEEIEDP